MERYDHRIPNSDIWLAAEVTTLLHGLDAPAVVGRAVAEFEALGKAEQAHAWRTVSLAVAELLEAQATPTPHSLH